jgi:hypothetical protein
MQDRATSTSTPAAAISSGLLLMHRFNLLYPTDRMAQMPHHAAIKHARLSPTARVQTQLHEARAVQSTMGAAQKL